MLSTYNTKLWTSLRTIQDKVIQNTWCLNKIIFLHILRYCFLLINNFLFIFFFIKETYILYIEENVTWTCMHVTMHKTHTDYNRRARVEPNLSIYLFWTTISFRKRASFFNLNEKLSKSKKPLHGLVTKTWYFAKKVLVKSKELYGTFWYQSYKIIYSFKLTFWWTFWHHHLTKESLTKESRNVVSFMQLNDMWELVIFF